MPHKFDPKQMHKLESEERKKLLPAKETLKKLLLEKGDDVADIGCGIGYFTIPAAKLITEEATIYGVDTSKQMLNELEKRVTKQGLTNIKLVNGEEYQANIPNNSIDFILISNVIHEIDDQDRFLANYLKKLKIEGKLAIIDFKKKENTIGPPLKDRISQQELLNTLDNHSLNVIKNISLNNQQYGIIAKKI
ncbi:class I SAM-dependent methyltransferase [Natroniella sp. ANB-PHB2]|uniref:class I SAM-dependent methyltransferase n=1 Tax=Natroniella sp. ANB-PHB2 TaxID=3384444 RepID=UPI0038D4F573